MELVDIGANLGHESFRDDLDAVLERARRAGVGQIVVTGTSVTASGRAAELAAARAGLWATAGVHPHEAAGFDEAALDALAALAARPEVVAIGECGLDYYRNYSPPEAQRRAFEAQLALAAELGMPVFLHQRDAHADFLAILDRWRARLPAAVVHCFTGDAAELDDYLARDCHIGITGWICDERRGSHLKELVGRIPPERLMIETDAPYLLPRDLSPKPAGRRNEPMHLAHIARVIAAACGRPPGLLARQTRETAQRFFGLDPNQRL
ncbi:MAG: preprotein translocase subunit TatD [Gammaproteobacteria bacterium]|nr:MAG: preprotein translocase subunit TatD [Gammaproteobacteria bacterium]